MLKIEKLSVMIGGNHIIKEVDIQVGENEMVGLIGPNGAGKSTILNSINRFVPYKGHILYKGKLLPSGDRLASAGIQRTFQHPQLAPDLTLLDNIRLGLYSHTHHSWIETIVRAGRFRMEEAETTSRALQTAKLCNIDKWVDAYPAHVPYGVQKLTELARAMVSHPSLILLDEPAAGLNNSEKMWMRDILRQYAASYSVSMLIVDHDIQFIFDTCQRLYAINSGKLIATGNPETIKQDPAVQEAYFGEQYILREDWSK